MAKVYLSYKLEDRDLAKQLADELTRLGHRVVYDAIALSPGGPWRQVLIEELSQADAVVVLLTERALSSPFVMGEIGAARALHHKFGHMLLLPVLPAELPIPSVVDDVFVVRLSPGSQGIRQSAAEIVQALDDHLTRKRHEHPRIFISHRHMDAGIAQTLVKLIEAAFDVEPSDLRCTSVHPYRLRAGERTADRLRSELGRAEAVLGILTPDTKSSSYVLFELGASWGRGSVTFPLLARGASSADVPAPIGDLHTLSLGDEAECHQLIDDLADVTTLRRQEKRAAEVAQRVAELAASARSLAAPMRAPSRVARPKK